MRGPGTLTPVRRNADRPGRPVAGPLTIRRLQPQIESVRRTPQTRKRAMRKLQSCSSRVHNGRSVRRRVASHWTSRAGAGAGSPQSSPPPIWVHPRPSACVLIPLSLPLPQNPPIPLPRHPAAHGTLKRRRPCLPHRRNTGHQLPRSSTITIPNCRCPMNVSRCHTTSCAYIRACPPTPYIPTAAPPAYPSGTTATCSP